MTEPDTGVAAFVTMSQCRYDTCGTSVCSRSVIPSQRHIRRRMQVVESSSSAYTRNSPYSKQAFNS
eukprot:scaffold3036_cov117-Cylindrotheca_fusiformis.AAC.2